MDYCFKDTRDLFFVMPFVRGGEFSKVIGVIQQHREHRPVLPKYPRLNEEETKFYAYQMVLAVGQLH